MNKQTLKIFKLHHRNKYWIGIKHFPNSEIYQKIKGMSESRYTKTHNCWYIPYTKISYYQLQQLDIHFICEPDSGTIGKLSPNDDPTGIGASAPHSALPSEGKLKKDADIIGLKSNENFKIRWTNKSFYIKLKYNEKDVQFVKSLSASFWDQKQKQWVVAARHQNLVKIQTHFNAWTIDDYEKLLKLISSSERPKTVTFFISPEYNQKLLVKISGFGASVTRIKAIPNRSYDQHYKKWIIPWSSVVYKDLKAYYDEMGYSVVDRVPQDAKIYERQLDTHRDKLNYLHQKYPERYRDKIVKFSLMMVRRRYSWKSITSYTGKLAKYIEFYPDKDIDQLTDDDANYYLSHIAKRQVSNSLINLTLSALKLYYEKVAYHDSFVLDRLRRPRKGRSLPTILSIREVDNMFRSIQNLKHLTLLYVIYGGGLRLSEVLNLRVQDILWDRNQVLIKSGKGNKDRMVMLSHSLKELLQQYFDEYKPQHWLFEGSDKKTQYSSSSVQKMVKTAALKAGISRKVTPHTLRHCFATHLMDNGTDTRYIQELLGHKDIRTTLIYTHVTTSSINAIESPLDKISRKGYKVKKRNG